VRDSRYHGGFDHPVRAFLIGVTLLVLLFGGFVVGTEAGTHPIEQTRSAVQVVTINGHVQTINVPVPVVRTVINGHTSVVRLPGSVHRQVVGGKTIYVYRAIEPAPSGSSGVTDSGASLFVVPTTVTVTVTTAADPVTSTVTETVPTTVTETAPSSSDSSGSTTGP
jgi:hypothetical protein